MDDLESRLSELSVEDGEPPPPRVLEEVTVEGVVKHFKKLQTSDNSESFKASSLSSFISFIFSLIHHEI